LTRKTVMPNGDKANEIRWRHGWEIVGPRRSEPLLASSSHTAGSLDQPLTDPKVKPRTTKRCPKNINSIAGIVATIEAAAMWPC
jgi:hypothetical protein